MNLTKNGDVLLCVIATSNDPYAASCVSAINNYFGYPDIPIGFFDCPES